jgi:hypothetical protein
MASTIYTRNLDGDYNRIGAGDEPVALDWNSDIQINSSYGIMNVAVSVWQADPLHDRLGVTPGMGVTLSDGLNPGSRVSIDGTPGYIMPGGSGTYNFSLVFPDPEQPGDLIAVPPAVVAKFIRALTYDNTAATLPDDFHRKISISISNHGDGKTGHEVIHEFVNVVKWHPHHHGYGRGGNWSTGGLNLPPEITGIPERKTIKDGSNPFSSVTVTDPNNDNLTVTIKIDDPRKGGFLASSLGPGTYDPETGVYTVTGTPDQVQAALRGLVFTQGSGLDGSRSSKESVSFQVIVSDRVLADAATMEADFRPNKADKLNGKSGSDKLYGHGGKDTIDGKGGSDKIWGGSGNDQLTGGTGRDVFAFDTKANAKTNKDAITDFSVRDDAIWLDNAFFSALGDKGSTSKPAQMKSSYFVNGSKAKDKNDYVIYDKAKGKLFYDADGSGKGKQVEIATLSKDLQMTYKDFFVI